jgi:hypothetical protein
MSTRSGRERYRRVVESRQSADRTQQMRDTLAGGIVRGQTMDLGDMSGDVAEPVVASFVWFGERFRVNPDLTETVVVDLFEAASRLKVTDPEQFAVAKDYVREHIHPDDFERLWLLAKSKRQNLEKMMTLCWGILEGIAERPTPPPSGSSDGRPGIKPNSVRGASDQGAGEPTIAEHLRAAPGPGEANSQPEWWPDGVPYNPAAAKYVDRFEQEGRPDKADMLMVAQEARAGR